MQSLDASKPPRHQIKTGRIYKNVLFYAKYYDYLRLIKSTVSWVIQNSVYFSFTTVNDTNCKVLVFECQYNNVFPTYDVLYLKQSVSTYTFNSGCFSTKYRAEQRQMWVKALQERCSIGPIYIGTSDQGVKTCRSFQDILKGEK